MDRVPVVLDTDIGSDIDDALALAYLLRQRRCELLGVTTVTGDTARRAALVEILCRAHDRSDVPVHAGAREVLLHGPGQPDVPQYAAVAPWPHQLAYQPGAAVDFLRATIRARPGEITLLAIGPLTNVATLFLVDPEIPSLLRRLVLMGGVYLRGDAPGLDEWNIFVDPVAAGVAFQRAAGTLTVVGLDVTERCRLPVAACRARVRAIGGPDILAAMIDAWGAEEGTSEVIFHDPLAAAIVFEPDLCRYATGRATVRSDESRPSGLTLWEPDPAGPHAVTVDVDAERFLRHYFEVVGEHARDLGPSTGS
jgi:purine nucleosidase